MAFRKLEIEFGIYDVIVIDGGGQRSTQSQHGIGFTYADTKLAAVVCNDQVLLLLADEGVSILPPYPSSQIVEAIEEFLDQCEKDPHKSAYIKELFQRRRDGTGTEMLRHVANPHKQNINN